MAAHHSNSSRLTEPLAALANAVAEEIGDRVRANLDATVGQDQTTAPCVLCATRNAASSKQLPPTTTPAVPAAPCTDGIGANPSYDDIRAALAAALSRLATLEGRQRAIQGKLAKLDSQWGGDLSNVAHAFADLQRAVASHQYAVADVGVLRSNLFALAQSLGTSVEPPAVRVHADSDSTNDEACA